MPTVQDLSRGRPDGLQKPGKAQASRKAHAYRGKGKGSLYLDEITPLQIESYKASWLKQGVTKSMVNRCLAILRKMFTLAVE
jgi:hypothetical protein